MKRRKSTGRSTITEEVRENFRAWRERNFADARAGRIGGESYTRAGQLDDAVVAAAPRRGRALWYAQAYDRGLVDHTEALRPDELRFLVSHPLVALQLAAGITDLRGLRCYRRGLTARINRLQQRSYRARYYARDNERRRRLAAERRRLTRRTTTNPCPTPEAFLAAFERRGESVEARIRFAGMVQDLECYVDNCLRFDENGEVRGRNGGIRAWIAVNLPQLSRRYKTIMRCKALAKRLRQAAGISDPVPTSAVYDGAPCAAEGDENYYALDSRRPGEGGLAGRLAAARRMLEGCPNEFAAVFGAVDAALDGLFGRGDACLDRAEGARSEAPRGRPERGR